MGLQIIVGTIYLVFILAFLSVVYKTAKRKLAQQENISFKEKVKQIVFIVISTLITVVALYTFVTVCFFSIWAGYEYVATSYSKHFLAGACFPVIYPTGDMPEPEATEEETIYESQDDVETVVSFLAQELDAIPSETQWRNDEKLWLIYKPNYELAPDYIFQCSMFYGNGLYEYSCIQITEQKEGSVIKTKWNILPTDIPYYCGV